MCQKRRDSIMIFILLLIPFSFLLNSHQTNAQDQSHLVYVIPVENEVERGLESFLIRTTNEAVENGADHIIFEIDTPGGRVDAASKISKLIQEIEIPTTAYIVKQSLSAGSYISLSADNIYMRPNATIGASGVITSDGNAADKKAQSAWKAEMRSVAESNGRDPIYAEAMADASIDLPDYNAPKGEFLTLTAKDAEEVGYSEGTVKNRVALLTKLGLENATIEEAEVSAAEGIARFVTNPIVIPILLSVASLGLILELYTPGFGVAGTMGLIGLGLFFYGHYIAGLAGMESILLLTAGIIFIVLEFFIMSGLMGILGVIAIVISLFMAGYNVTQMAMSISIAAIVSILALIILFKWIGTKRGILKRVILRDRTSSELGYSSFDDHSEYLGQEGITETPLRPSGIMSLSDKRLDVVTEGAYIEKGKKVKIIQVEGMRIVVREIKS